MLIMLLSIKTFFMLTFATDLYCHPTKSLNVLKKAEHRIQPVDWPHFFIQRRTTNGRHALC